MMPHSEQVLLIDDDQQILRLFTHILVGGGLSVVVASSGKKALGLLKTQAFKLVIVDMNMPSPDGFEVLKAIRSMQQRPRVLAVSGFEKGELLGAAGFLGADATLSKGDAPELLLSTARNLIA
jgi:CheY-like chemotaxis protein